jgi:hypothetical protein
LADKRRNNGGHSTKGVAGRKSKAEEQRIRDIVSPYVDGAIDAVVNIMKSADKDADKLAAAKLILAYAYGQPKAEIDLNNNIKGDIPIDKWLTKS